MPSEHCALQPFPIGAAMPRLPLSGRASRARHRFNAAETCWRLMSEHDVTIVDIETSLADAPAQAAQIIAWLQSEAIIGEGVPRGEFYRRWLGTGGDGHRARLAEDPRLVYRPGPAVSQATARDLSPLFRNWLEVDIERQVFTAGEAGIGIFCEACHADQAGLGDGWSRAISDWHGGGEGMLACAACGFRAPLSGWTFDPAWAFGNLGFRFCDWVFRPGFIEDFRRRLGRASRVVHCHR